jgi:hypothetical protein
MSWLTSAQYQGVFLGISARNLEWCGFSATEIETTFREMVRLTGIEPVTPSFGNWYSIQLSYRRVFECFGALDQSAIIRPLISDC